MEDWQALCDLVVSRGWAFEYREGETVLPLPAARTVLSRSSDAECATLRVRPYPHLLVVFCFLCGHRNGSRFT